MTEKSELREITPPVSKSFAEEMRQALTSEKAVFVMGQLRQLKRSIKLGNPAIRCECGNLISVQSVFRCLYCAEWYCQRCAEIHFGMTREEWASDHSDLDIAALDAQIEQCTHDKK